MKPTNLLALFAALIFAACGKSPAPATADESPADATPAPAPRIAETKPAPAEPAQPAAAPVQNFLAPDGVYFLLAKKSVETDDGLIGFKPGSRVVKQPDGSYLAEGHKLDLGPDEITNDLRIARQIAGADAAAQAAIRAASAARAPANADPAEPEVPGQPDPRPRVANRPSDAPAPTPANSLERSAFGQKKVFGDEDSHGRSFNIRRR